MRYQGMYFGGISEFITGVSDVIEESKKSQSNIEHFKEHLFVEY